MSQLIDQRTTARLEAIPATSGPLMLGATTRVLPATPAAGPQRRVSLFEQISINVYTFAGNFQWQLLVAIVIPSLVVKFLGDANKDINLAMVVIWALAADALPPTDEAGKFMGIWTAMGTLPQILGLCIGAVILQLLHGIPNHFGYTALFLLTVVYFALGTLAIRKVRNVR